MTNLRAKLAEIVGDENVSNDINTLETYYKRYSENFLVQDPIKPQVIVKVQNRAQIEEIVKLANTQNFTIVPISSKISNMNGADVPHAENSVILDLTDMNAVLNVDVRNRVCMIEAGVTYEKLFPILKDAGLRLLNPLLPSCGKSVVTAALEREPTIMPRYHWDASDPLLCTEVIFGTGDLFRTGTAAGPGTIEEQRASGQAQVNPLGPTQFDPFRIIQGAQGTIGIVSWITMKCELLPDTRKILFIQSENLEELLDFQYRLLKRRFGDELFIVNNLNLAALVQSSREDITKLQATLPSWTLLIGLAGRGNYGTDRIAFLEAEIGDIAKEQGVRLLNEIKNISNDQILHLFDSCTDHPWRLRYLGGSQDVFFITTLDKTPEFIAQFTNLTIQQGYPTNSIGTYIQPLVQGCNCHCEFNIYYDPLNPEMKQQAKTLFIKGGSELMDRGAFFSRPYGFWAYEMYKRVSPVVVDSLQKVKSIFDPNNVLNRGALCFKEAI